MAYDLKLTHAQIRLARKVASGTSVAQEGLLVCSVIEDGIEKCKVVDVVAGAEKVLGYSILADALPDQLSAVEVITVPTSGPLVVDLRATNLLSLRTRAVVTGGPVLTIDETYAGAPAAGVVKVDLVNGLLKFNAAEAGATVTVTYTYSLTMPQALQIFGDRFINNRALHATFGEIELGSGLCELHTTAFNTALDYSGSTPLTLGNGGVITQGGAGPVLNAVVIATPEANGGKLGVRISFLP
jgi:hypothetical protein